MSLSAEPNPNDHACVPGPSLSGSIALLWSHQSPSDAPPRRELSLPEGTVELIINLTDPSDRGMVVCGPHSRPFLAETPQGASLAAVHFHPGGAAPFFDLPLSELHNRIVPLEALWGPTAAALRDALRVAPSEKRLPMLEAALRRRLLSRSPRSPIADILRAFHQNPNRKVAAVAESIGWSERRLHRFFRDRVGLSPKGYCRLRRFQSVLRQVPPRAPVPWAELAQICGYFDQSHLVHDFRELAGVSPTVYQASRNRHPNHLPPPDPTTQ